MKQTKDLTGLMVILLIVLPLVSSCCTEPLNQTIDPELHFPRIPDPITKSGEPVVNLIENNQTVEMPIWYWQAIVRYLLEMDKTRLQYKAWYRVVFEE